MRGLGQMEDRGGRRGGGAAGEGGIGRGGGGSGMGRSWGEGGPLQVRGSRNKLRIVRAGLMRRATVLVRGWTGLKEGKGVGGTGRNGG